MKAEFFSYKTNISLQNHLKIFSLVFNTFEVAVVSGEMNYFTQKRDMQAGNNLLLEKLGKFERDIKNII